MYYKLKSKHMFFGTIKITPLVSCSGWLFYSNETLFKSKYIDMINYKTFNAFIHFV